ncbi:MAG: B12-binding domain-containing radical SAM protein [Candidatus Omnitrophica bacterium]|nr:B12-binding domain-containing radical SAM protein [Candidatus Omnitrophota bacterium]
MRVLFVQENAISELIGFTCLSAYLKERGHVCNLLLLTHTRDWLRDIRDYDPDLIGFSIFTGMQDSVYRIIQQIKKNFNIPVIVGGPHPTFYPRECMEECPEIDMVCRGDGEETLLKLINALQDKTDYRHIAGLWVREKNRIFENSISTMIKDVDSLPLPDRDLYFKFDFLRNFPMKRFISGYGCPYNCSYCNQPFFEQEYKKEHPVTKDAFMRYKTVDRVIEEILYVKNNTMLKRVHFSDDLFCIKRDWLREFADKYPKAIGVPFSCNMRFDIIDKEFADLLKKSMCCAVQSGIESGNDYLRNKVIRKQLSREKIIQGSRLLRERRIKIYTTNIVALPGETLDNAIETIKLNQEINADHVRINTLIPFPKTKIVDYAIQHGYLPRDYGLKDLNTSDSLHIHCKTSFANEFKNISCLFRLFLKFKFLMRFFKPIVGVKNNAFFRAIGFLNLVQDARYFQIDILSGIRFYLNTIFRSKGDVMHWVPGMKGKDQ